VVLDLDHDFDLDESGRAVRQDCLDVLYLPDPDAAERHGRALFERLHGARKVEREAVPPRQPASGAESDDGDEDESDRSQDEGTDQPRMGLRAHKRPRSRKARTLASGCSRRSRGLPRAITLRRSPSRKTASSPSAKMLGNSCVTRTTVVPALSRCSRMRSSSRREVKGSSPAEGSSRYRIEGSSAMARAR